MENTESKLCRKCGIVKPLSAYNKDSSRIDGLDFYCSICKKEAERIRRDKRRPFLPTTIKIKTREELRAIGKKECCDCKRILGQGMFDIDRSRWDGFKQYCKTCKARRQYKWYYSNLKVVQRRAREQKRRRETNVNEYNREYYRKNWLYEISKILSDRHKRTFKKEIETIMKVEVPIDFSAKRPKMNRKEIISKAVEKVMATGASEQLQTIITRHAMMYHSNETTYFEGKMWKSLFTIEEFAKAFWPTRIHTTHIYKLPVTKVVDDEEVKFWECPRCGKLVKDGEISINECTVETWKENMWVAIRSPKGLKFIRNFING